MKISFATKGYIFLALIIVGFFTWAFSDNAGLSASAGNFMEVAGIVLMILAAILWAINFFGRRVS